MSSRTFTVMLATLFFALGCSSSYLEAPVEPAVNDSGLSSAGDYGSGRMLWGFWAVSIDPETLAVDVIPHRDVQFTANVTRFLQPPISPTHRVQITVTPQSEPANGYFVVDVSLLHPFPGMPIYRGFDVRGVFIANGSIAFGPDPSAVWPGTGDARLLNADGFTRWWNPTEFTSIGTIFGFTKGALAPPVMPSATLNAFKYFADDLDKTEHVWNLDPGTRGTFSTSPGVNTRTYEIQFAMNGGKPDFTFNYAVDASWELPDPEGFPSYDIEYYPLSANVAEAYCISVADNGSTAWYVDDTDKGGALNLAIRVFDWQSVQNPGGVPGELSSLWLDSPVLASPVNVLPTATVLPDGPTSSVFEVSLGDLNLTKSGDFPMMVFAGSANPSTYQPQVAGGDKFAYPSAPLGAYFLAAVNIKSVGQGNFVVTAIDPSHAKSSEKLTGVVVTGDGFMPGAQVELRHPDWPAIAATNENTSSATTITADFDLYAAAAGLWDVVVINPSSQEASLDDGFSIDCADGVQSYDQKYLLTGGTPWNYCQRGDLAILETGPYKGQCVVKRYTNYDSTALGFFVRFDPDSPGNKSEVDFFSVPGSKDGLGNYWQQLCQIDQNPVTGDIAVVNGRMYDWVQIVTQNGSWLEEFQVTDPGTVAGKIPAVPAVDFDADGDMWIVVHVNAYTDSNPTPMSGPWQLRHYRYESGTPHYKEVLADRLDITSYLLNDLISPATPSYYVADMAVSYTEDVAFVLSTGLSGSGMSLITKFDLSSSPPTFLKKANVLPPVVFGTNPWGVSRLDIEFDHTDLSAENCRLMVMYQTWNGTSVDVHLMRLDTQLNVLANEKVSTGHAAWENPHAIAINTDGTNHNIIGIDMNYTAPFNDFWYYPAPAGLW